MNVRESVAKIVSNWGYVNIAAYPSEGKVIICWPPVPGWRRNKLSVMDLARGATQEAINAAIAAEVDRLRAENFDPVAGAYIGGPPAEPEAQPSPVVQERHARLAALEQDRKADLRKERSLSDALDKK